MKSSSVTIQTQAFEWFFLLLDCLLMYAVYVDCRGVSVCIALFIVDRCF